MAEGTLMETMIAVGSAVTVVFAVALIAWRLMAGDAQKRRLEKLKEELTQEARK
ncbi:MAG: hypothetical protein IT382_04760 [Deltaproteobacteria bacterium]|nr:hypothetical protein [Deltaproteobacteria bacterium]